jgi:hypothetical protein
MAFSDFTGLSVGSTALEIGVANIILKKMIQQQLYRDGIGITEVYSNGATAGGAVLRVPKVTASTSSFRQLGATVNGNFFNGNSIGVIGLGEELLVCNNIYDACEDVPQAQHILSLGGAAALGVRAEEIAKNIARQMNAGTMAYQIAAVLNAVITASGTKTDRIFTYNPATAGDPLAKFLEACASLDNGDTYNDVFPSVGRLALLRPTGLTDLRKSGSIIVGGSNFAQEMVKSGAVDPETILPDVPGYRGMINDVAVFSVSNALWTLAESWMQQSAGYLANVVGIICAYNATGRGHAFPDSTKVIDSPSGQGLRIQPLSNFGVKVFFEKGIKLLANAAVVEGASAITVLAPGSQE